MNADQERLSRKSTATRESTWIQKQLFLLKRCARLNHAQQNLEQEQPALQIYGDQKIFLGMLFAIFAQLRRELRMREQIADLIRAALHGMHQSASKLVDDLCGN